MLPEDLVDTCDIHTQEEKDTTKPVIRLKGSLNMSIQQNEEYEELGATATDDKDGDITDRIVITGKVDTSKIGTYIVTYTVKDNAGNETTAQRTIKVVEKTSGGNNTGDQNQSGNSNSVGENSTNTNTIDNNTT